MRVLMYGWEFPPHFSGGLGIACHGLIEGLCKEGIEVRYVLPRKFPVVKSSAKIIFATEANPLTGKEAELFNSGYMSETRLRFLQGQYPELQYGPSLYDEVLRYAALAPLVALQNIPDVIHVHDWLCFPAGMAAKRATGAPLVVHVHATEFDRTGRFDISNPITDIERRGLHEADRICAVSNHTKNIIVEKYGINPDKVEVVYNGVDPQGTNILTEEERKEVDIDKLKNEGWKIVLFVGRITIQKGPDYFLDAAKKVLEHNPKTLFIVNGSGDMEKQIIERAAYLGIGDKVLFTGFKKDKELGWLFSAANLVVLPSISEPFGLVPLEALLNDTPVLVSKQCGVGEVLRNALKSDFWDIDDMADKIIAVLNHTSLQQTLAEEGGREARSQTWSKVATRCIMVYKSLVKKLVRV